MMKKLLAAAALGVMSFSMVMGASAAEDAVKIGYISPGPDTWYLRAEEGAKWACDLAGAEFISVNSNRDSQQEQTNIEYLINEGVDCIVILSWNEAGCVTAAEMCEEAGIGCVVFDACGVMANHDVTLTAAVDFDWQSMGGTYAEWMKENYPGEPYVFISGTMDSVVCQTVEASLQAATEELGSNECVDVRYGEYDPEKAANEIEDLVNSGLEFSVIGVINEDCAAAVATRLSDLGVADQYHIFAQNGSDTGVDLLNAGMIEFTIASSPGMEGAVAVLAGIDAVKNGTIDANASVACPIASVTPDQANDPTVVIPWAVDEEAWASVISENAPEYAYFFE
ncbi:MAG: sugar ABC transporter substrate-binding protein [Candidatus Choladocola sp.]|nr:sugar ABC transporter substrate-binding protein [Candidatus Choladocola sp.]